MIVAIEGVKRVCGLDFVIFEEGICEVKLLQSVQARKHDECIICLYSLSSIN